MRIFRFMKFLRVKMVNIYLDCCCWFYYSSEDPYLFDRTCVYDVCENLKYVLSADVFIFSLASATCTIANSVTTNGKKKNADKQISCQLKFITVKHIIIIRCFVCHKRNHIIRSPVFMTTFFCVLFLFVYYYYALSDCVESDLNQTDISWRR